MKKIIVIICTFILTITLFGCDNSKQDFELKMNSISELRDSIVFECSLIDEKKLLENSEVRYALKKANATKNLKEGLVSFEADNTSKVTISSLDPNTEYVVNFTTGYKGKSVNLGKYEVKTSNQGIVEAPYEISDASQFSTLLKNDPSGHFILVNDIDFEGSSISPLFNNKSVFKGVFDGNGKTIKNFVMGSEENPRSITDTSYLGIFGYIGEAGVIKNVKFDNCQLYMKRTSKGYFAFLAGYNAGTITDITISNSKLYANGTTSEYYCGGLVAQNENHGSISNCVVDLDIVATCSRSFIVGGIFAENESEAELPIRNIVSNCTFSGDINVKVESTSSSQSKTNIVVGGIGAKNYSKVTDCQVVNSIIKVSSSFQAPHTTSYEVVVGGLIGKNIADIASLVNCQAKVSLDVTSYDAVIVNVGFLVAENGAGVSGSSIMKNCLYTLPENQENIVNILKDKEYNIGLVGVNKVDYSDVTYLTYKATADFSVAVNTYQKVDKVTGVDEDGKDIIETVIELLSSDELKIFAE